MKYLVLRFPQKIKLDSWGNRFFVDFISFKKDLSKQKACDQSDALHLHLGYMFGNIYTAHVIKGDRKTKKTHLKHLMSGKKHSIHILPLFFASVYILVKQASQTVPNQNLYLKSFRSQSLLRLFSLSSKSASASASVACGSAFFPAATERLPPVEGRPV